MFTTPTIVWFGDSLVFGHLLAAYWVSKIHIFKKKNTALVHIFLIC